MRPNVELSRPPRAEVDSRSRVFQLDAIRLDYAHGTLDQVTINMLDREPGWIWDAPVQASVRKWNLTVVELEAFGADPRRSSRTPRLAQDPDELRLHDWVRYQRRHQDELCHYQVERLLRVPFFTFAPREDAWDERLEDYLVFVEVERHAPSVHAARGSLERRAGVWAANQRAAHKRGQLPYRRVIEAGGLPFWYWSK